MRPHMQRLTDREKQLFKTIIRLERSLDDSQPDVGMGPSWETLANRAGLRCGMPISIEDQQLCVKECIGEK
jgi:hypothetical protein